MSTFAERKETRILLVEDEAIVARDLVERLKGLGYSVAGTAASGQEALELAGTTHPSLVFMDITIQGPMDGVETATEMGSRMDVPIIFLTAHTDTGTMQRAKGASPYGYLIKPLDDREILGTVEMAMSRYASEVPARLIARAIAGAGLAMMIASARAPDHLVTMCNPAFERLTGWMATELIARRPWFLQDNLADRTARDRLREALRDGVDRRVSCLVDRKGRGPLECDVAVSRVRDLAKDPTHFLLCVTETPRGRS